jgi:drug/metabolite transporter (DMT)-like permease
MGQGLRNWSVLLLIGLIWGSSFILMKKGLVVFTDTQVAALRIGIAWLVTMPFLIPKLKQITRKQWGILLAAGLLGNGIQPFSSPQPNNIWIAQWSECSIPWCPC